jgi:hypothetical protein
MLHKPGKSLALMSCSTQAIAQQTLPIAGPLKEERLQVPEKSQKVKNKTEMKKL